MPKSELQKRIDGDLVGLAAGSALAGSSGGVGGGVDHGALVGLLDDDHPQYPNLIQAETVTGNWTFNPSGAPFTIGASAIGQLVTGLNADQVDGLDEPDLLLVDGSNALTGNLSVDPGITIDGVDLSAHAADANAHHNQVHDIVGSDHTLTASQFQLVGATAVDTLGLLTPVSDATSTPDAILKSDTNGDLTLRRLSIADNLIHAGDPDTRLTFSADLIQIFAGNAAFLTLQKTTQDLVRIGTGGGADVDIDFNSQAKMFGDDGSWHFGGITAPNAKVDITRTGEQLRLLYDGSNYTAFDVGASGTLDILAVGDIVLSPTGEDVLPLGSVGVDLGDYNRMWRTLFAAELYVETLVAQDVLATIGGRVMVAPTTKLIADVDGVQTTIDVEHNNLASGDFVLLKTAPGGAAQIEAMKITSGATVITGGYRYSVSRNQDGTGANSWVEGDAVANLGSAAGEGYIELTSTQTIHSHLGPNITIYSRTAATNWDDSNPVVSLGNLESFVDYAADEFGLAIGNDLILTPTTGLKGLTADRTNGLRMFNTDIALYNGSTQTVDIASDGNAWFGSNSSNKTLQVTTTGANAGDVEVGDYSAGNDGVIWDESASALKVRGELRLEGSGGALIRAYASGIFAEDASNNPSFALVNEDTISWNSETLNTRDVLIGDNSTSKANIFFDASAGKFQVRSGTTVQVEINTSGQVVAGTDTTLDSDGLKIAASTTSVFGTDEDPNAVTWRDSSSNDTLRIWNYVAGATGGGEIKMPAVTSRANSLIIQALTPSGQIARTFLRATGGALTAEVRAYADGTDSYVAIENKTFINDTGNANMTLGMTINQGGNDDEALALKSSDVAHGMTSQAETDTYLALNKQSAVDGGLRLKGLSSDIIGLNFQGYVTNGATAKSTGALGAIIATAGKKSGTTVSTFGTNENLFVVRDFGNTRFIVDAEGDIHMDATSNQNAWDAENDTELLRALSLAVGDPAQLIKSQFDEFLQYNRQNLVDFGILSEGGFINWSQTWRVMLGAIWQQHIKIRDLEAQIHGAN